MSNNINISMNLINKNNGSISKYLLLRKSIVLLSFLDAIVRMGNAENSVQSKT